MIDGLKRVDFRDGEILIREGEVGDHFYIIEKGSVECGHAAKDGTFSTVRVLAEGETFGEIALINNVRRTMSVRSVNNS